MKHLAIDIGAESGRGAVGEIVNHKLHITEVHRFANTPVQFDGSLRWDTETLIGNIKQAIHKSGDIASVGLDTWGVDFALLDANDQLIEQPYCYRDSRTDGVMEKVFNKILKERIYEQTGIQFMQINSLFQLCATPKETLKKAHHFLTMPDYLNFALLNEKQANSEFTIATTTQCFNPNTQDWAYPLLEQLEIPSRIFPITVQPGTKLGHVDNALLIAPSCHDTACAVAAVPAEGEDFAWISSGTWSIMGIESDKPIINQQSYKANITNEGGVANTFRVSKNVMGLWLVQQCRATWAAQGEDYSYEKLATLAENADVDEIIFDVDHPECLKPCDMPALIRKLTDKPALQDPGQIIRIVLQSLAAKYAEHLQTLETITGRKLNRIHIVGGGSQNKLLNRLTEEACKRPVIEGPVEATAIGNIMMQMIAMGELGSIAEGRKVVRDSFGAP